MKYYPLIILSIILISGCQTNNYKPSEVPNIQDNPEAFMCISNEDCVMQETSCNNCNCPRAINKEYEKPLDCPNIKDQAFCNLYCFPTVPKCINKTCQGISKDS